MPILSNKTIRTIKSLVWEYISRVLPDEVYVKRKFLNRMGFPLDLKDPKTFNEKLQWLKLYDRKPIYTKMVDKYEAKKYVASIIGEKYIIPTLGIYNDFDEISFEKLPNQFVLKCTHDSGGVVICKDKDLFDVETAKEKINKSLKRNFYWEGREWPYKNVKPRIIAEQLMVDESGFELKDYKFFCFNGEPKFFKIDYNRQVEHHANYYNLQGEIIPVDELVCPRDSRIDLKLPNNMHKMIEIAAILSKGIPFVRVDLYNINGSIYWGEMTFYPATGMGKFAPQEWDYTFGSYLELPNH